ncbi:MAG: hypothetical protein JSV09_16875 [Thermoplasmata archaeon]|nr:MAG: hypothetical protein JSV09_16875 [Thermoplasmata archaeon]
MKEDEIEEDFLKALLITVGYMALFSLLIFIPLIGFIMAFTIGAYVAGYRGGRYSVDWRKVGLLAAIIWSTILVILLILAMVSMVPFNYDIKIGGWEIAIICIPYILNIIFCVLGARASFKKRAVYL